MEVLRIERADDSRIADYRGLADGALMRSRGLFVAEGRLVVGRLVAGGRFGVRSLFVTDTALAALGEAVAERLGAAPVYVASRASMREVTGFRFHQGCLALGERPSRAPSLIALLAGEGPIVVMEGVTHADNVGAVFRNAAAFGADAVLLDPTTVDPLYRESIRVSMAATLDVPFARITDWPGDLARLQAAGWTLIALTPRSDAMSIRELSPMPRVAWLIGSEGEGLSSAVLAQADVRVRIPIAPAIDSLNVAAATAIAFYAGSLR